MRSSVHVGSVQRSVIHQPQRLPSCQASKVESAVSIPFSFSWLFRELSGVLSSCQRLLPLFSVARLRPPSSPDPLPARRSAPAYDLDRTSILCRRRRSFQSQDRRSNSKTLLSWLWPDMSRTSTPTRFLPALVSPSLSTIDHKGFSRMRHCRIGQVTISRYVTCCLWNATGDYQDQKKEDGREEESLCQGS